MTKRGHPRQKNTAPATMLKPGLEVATLLQLVSPHANPANPALSGM